MVQDGWETEMNAEDMYGSGFKHALGKYNDNSTNPKKFDQKNLNVLNVNAGWQC